MRYTYNVHTHIYIYSLFTNIRKRTSFQRIFISTASPSLSPFTNPPIPSLHSDPILTPTHPLSNLSSVQTCTVSVDLLPLHDGVTYTCVASQGRDLQLGAVSSSLRLDVKCSYGGVNDYMELLLLVYWMKKAFNVYYYYYYYYQI